MCLHKFINREIKLNLCDAMGKFLKEMKKKIEGNSFRKGQMNMLVPTVITIVVVVVVLAMGALLLNKVGDTFDSGSAADNITTDGLTTLEDLGELVGPVGTVMFIAVIVAILVGMFAYRSISGGR